MFIISVYIRHHITFPSIIWRALCVMDVGTAQLTVGCMTKVVQKCVCFAKINRSAIQLFEAAKMADFYVTINFISIIILL